MYFRYRATQTPFIKGYGSKRNFERLIKGTIDDYRDNYSAGCALYVFLNTWAEKRKMLFKARLARFMKTARNSRKEPLSRFVDHFADGKNGRPKGLDAFMKIWHLFLSDCYKYAWRDKTPEWLLERYVLKREDPFPRNKNIIENCQRIHLIELPRQRIVI